MKVVILAGGYGTRLSEETDTRPKPMVEIGGKPILWHIMKIYSHYGFSDFIVCLGYKGDMIKRYFSDLYLQSSDFTVDTGVGKITVHRGAPPNWRVSLIDTGVGTLTGGRLLRIKNFIEGDTFMMTYGDGVSNVDLSSLLEFHKKHGKIATLTAVRPPSKFGVLHLDESELVKSFHEKSDGQGTWINGGFFVLNSEVFNYIGDDDPYFEDYPLRDLSRDGELFAFKHNGFWRPMDTMNDKRVLEDLWSKGVAEWKIWRD